MNANQQFVCGHVPGEGIRYAIAGDIDNPQIATWYTPSKDERDRAISTMLLRLETDPTPDPINRHRSTFRGAALTAVGFAVMPLVFGLGLASGLKGGA